MFAASKGLLRVSSPDSGPQRVEGLGFRPQALVLWWSRQPLAGAARGNRGGLGFAAASGGQSSVAWVSEDAATPTRAQRWLEGDAILGFDSADDRAPALRGRIVSFDEDGFTVGWLIRPSFPWLVNYLALGGDDLTHAAVLGLAASEFGLQAVTGIGFEPDCLMLVPTGIERPGETAAGVLASVGIATRTACASVAFSSSDGVPVATVRGAQRTDAVVALPVPGTAEFGALGRLISLDSDGFTLDWSLSGSEPRWMVGLALKGGSFRLGAVVSPPQPRRQQAVDVGFRPSGLLVFSWGLESSREIKDIGRLCLGGASGPLISGCSSWGDLRWAEPSSTHVRSTEDALLEVMDTRSGGLHAQAALEALDTEGFTLDWNIADSFRRQFVYLALGSSVTVSNDAGTRLRLPVRRRLSERGRGSGN